MTLSYNEAVLEVAELTFTCPPGSHWRHRNGGIYEVVSIVIIEGTMSPAITYRCIDLSPALTWCRPASEFVDGRFSRVTP